MRLGRFEVVFDPLRPPFMGGIHFRWYSKVLEHERLAALGGLESEAGRGAASWD